MTQAYEERLNVSRETFSRLETLVDLLKKWNPRINLVSKSTLDTLWERHILDSVQVFRAADRDYSKWVDIGSGGGFPGLVVAILAAEENPGSQITMIESDQRKCAFLRTVLRETGISGNVIAKRIEAVEPQGADILSARALADLSKLFEFAERHLSEGGVALFPKGVTWEKELNAARKTWSFEAEVIKSETESGAVILKIEGLSRV